MWARNQSDFASKKLLCNLIVIASVQYNANSMAFILAFILASSERTTCNAILYILTASLPLRKRLLRIEADYKEPAYRNFYSSSFEQPLPETQRIEAMNA